MNETKAFHNGPASSVGYAEAPQVKSTLFNDYLNEFENVVGSIEKTSYEIKSKLNIIVDTNFPQDEACDGNKSQVRGNSDIEETLFRGLDRLRQLDRILYTQVEKLSNII